MLKCLTVRLSNIKQKSTMKNATIVLLIKKNEEKITEVCLAMKKRGFGEGRWNGVGGKVKEDETIEEGAKREAFEEISVENLNLIKVAEMDFFHASNIEWNQKVHVFLADKWTGTPIESEEMNPNWFKINEIPYDEMWPDDSLWIPKVLGGKLVKAVFNFGDIGTMETYNIKEVERFE